MLQAGDADTARAHVLRSLGGTVYASRIFEQLDVAIGGDDDECRALVATSGGEIRCVALAGVVAGARHVVKLHALIGDDRDSLVLVARAVVDGSARAGARLIVCEVADDAPFSASTHALREAGFAEEGRVADFVRDGMAMLILVWRQELSSRRSE